MLSPLGLIKLAWLRKIKFRLVFFGWHVISPIRKAAKKAIAYIPCNSLLLYSVAWVWTQEEMMCSRMSKEIGKRESLAGLSLL